MDDGWSLLRLRAIAEVPEDPRFLRDLLRFPEPERNTRVGRPVAAGIGRDALHARQQYEQAEDHAHSHARRVYHTDAWTAVDRDPPDR